MNTNVLTPIPVVPTPIPVVFIPALLCDEAMYRDVIEALGEMIEAHVLLSPKVRLEESAADILARAPAAFVLVGASYGGSLALEVVLAAPERVIALCLTDCDPSAPQPGGPDLAGGLAATPDTVVAMLAGLVVRPEATGAAAAFKAMAGRVRPAAGAAQAEATAARREATSRLSTLTMPALVLWGEEDPLMPVSLGRVLADALPHAHFHVLPSCGHLPTLEKPAECAALIGNFLHDKLQLK